MGGKARHVQLMCLKRRAGRVTDFRWASLSLDPRRSPESVVCQQPHTDTAPRDSMAILSIDTTGKPLLVTAVWTPKKKQSCSCDETGLAPRVESNRKPNHCHYLNPTHLVPQKQVLLLEYIIWRCAQMLACVSPDSELGHCAWEEVSHVSWPLGRRHCRLCVPWRVCFPEFFFPELPRAFSPAKPLSAKCWLPWHKRGKKMNIFILRDNVSRFWHFIYLNL